MSLKAVAAEISIDSRTLKNFLSGATRSQQKTLDKILSWFHRQEKPAPPPSTVPSKSNLPPSNLIKSVKQVSQPAEKACPNSGSHPFKPIKSAGLFAIDEADHLGANEFVDVIIRLIGITKYDSSKHNAQVDRVFGNGYALGKLENVDVTKAYVGIIVCSVSRIFSQANQSVVNVKDPNDKSVIEKALEDPARALQKREVVIPMARSCALKHGDYLILRKPHKVPVAMRKAHQIALQAKTNKAVANPCA